MFVVYLILGIPFFLIGYVIGLKHGFNECKRIDDKIIDELISAINEKE